LNSVGAENSDTGNGTANGSDAPQADSPRIDFAQNWRDSSVRPPPKPFAARASFKTNPFFGKSQSGGKSMSDKFSQDRMAAFTPQISKRVVDIPNLAARGQDAEIDGKRLVIGKQIRMSGEISGCERLVVEGKVEANLSDVKTIDVTANGTFKGNAEVESAVIAGTYEGNLKVNGHLEIAPSGVVKGGVSYKTISVANGGKVLGTIESIDS